MIRLLLVAVLATMFGSVYAQNPTTIIVLHDTVGESIDSTEKTKYHLFTFWSAKQFNHAEFLMNADSTLSIRGTMKDGAVYIIPCTKKEFDQYNYQVRYYAGLVPKKSGKGCGEALGAGLGSLVGTVTAFISWRHSSNR